MATFEAKKLELTQINGGQEYEQGDFLQSDTINDVVEGTAYAQNVAEAANTTSNKAVSTANSANKTANDASTKVDGFDERITAAKNKADTAYDNAATAQNTADNATTEINKIKNGTTVVPNANHANNADNANLATKAQQDVNGNPINTTYATRDFVTEQQGTRVKVNNANVAELSFTSDPQTQLNSKANQNGSYKTLSAGALIVDDTRSVNSPPSYYYGKGSKVTSEFKNCSTVGLPSDDTYCTVVTVCPWSDDSGGAVTQTAFVGNTKYTRKSTSDTAWGDWGRDLVISPNEILPYTAANGWTRIERFGAFPPKSPVDNKVYAYLLVAIPAHATDDDGAISGKDGSYVSAPSLVMGGFTSISVEDLNFMNTPYFLQYSFNATGANRAGYLMIDSSFLSTAYTGMGQNGAFYAFSDNSLVTKLKDDDLDGIAYVYKRIV